MKTLDENLEMLSRSLLSDAHSEADEILSEAKARADAIRQKALDEAEAEGAKILEQASREAERMRSQAIATTQLKARNLLLENREKTLENVFKTAREQLVTVKQWTDYQAIVVRLLHESLVQLKATKAVVRADPTTQSMLTDAAIENISKELNISITLGQPLDKGIGMIVETANGRLNFDNTLETRLGRLQSIIRAPVYHLLMGEKL